MTSSLIDHLGMPIDDDFTVHRAYRAEDPDKLIEDVGERITGICCGGHGLRIDGAMMDRLPNLKIIANFGVGYDTIDAVEAGRRGVIVTNTPNVLNEEVADTAIGLLLMTVREFGRAEQYLRGGNWPKSGDYPLTKLTLRGRHVGIVGLGRIGREIAQRCEGFGLKISYFGRTQKQDVPYQFYDDLTAMARNVDTMIVITPGTAETKNLINAPVLEALGSQGVLINIARGSVVDETALIAALKANTIAAAGLDVMWNEPNIDPTLMTLENCVLLPHVGSASLVTRKAMGQLVIDNLATMRDGKPPLTPVPETAFKGW